MTNPALAPITPESREERVDAAKRLLSHTPTPWQYEEPEPGDSSVGIQSSGPAVSANVQGCPETIPICEMMEPAYLDHSVPRDDPWWPDNAWKPVGNAIANAKFVVLACNFHDELVGALKIVLAEIDKEWGDCGCCPATPEHPGQECMSCHVRALLARIKEESHA